MTATSHASRRSIKTLIGLLLMAGLSVGALTYSSAPARSAAPASAGSQIAFTRTENPLPGTEESDQAEIWVMNGKGTGQRRLTCNDTFDLGAVWSPDGKTIAFQRNGSIVTVPLGPGDESVLTNSNDNDSSPAWNPIQARGKE